MGRIFLLLAFLITFSQSVLGDLARLQEMNSRKVYRGDQPDNLEDYLALQKIGIRTIINLRNDRTVRAEVLTAQQFGMKVVSFPMSTFTYPSKAKVWAILQAMNDPKLQPVYVHCQFGKDRTGLISALYRVHYQGMHPSDAFNEMLYFGFSPLLINFEAFFFRNI